MSWEPGSTKKARRRGMVRMLVFSAIILLCGVSYRQIEKIHADDARHDANRLAAMKRISWDQAQLVRDLRGAAKHEAKREVTHAEH